MTEKPYTPNSCDKNLTHYQGCECHEAKRDREIAEITKQRDEAIFNEQSSAKAYAELEEKAGNEYAIVVHYKEQRDAYAWHFDAQQLVYENALKQLAASESCAREWKEYAGKLRDALSFYRSAANWLKRTQDPCSGIIADTGSIASKALALPIPGEKE